MKKLFYISSIIVVVFATVSINVFFENTGKQETSANENTEFEIVDGQVSELAMQGVPEKMKNTAVTKYDLKSKGDIHKTKFKIKVKNTKKQQNELEVSTHGSIIVNGKKLNFKANGLLEQFNDTENGKEYLYGILTAESNNGSQSALKVNDEESLDVLLLFDKNNTDNYYVAISYGIDTDIGVIIYGDAELNREFNLYLQVNTDEEVYL
ncbi:hypothetical protein CEW92_15320 [Bacillaceae bacterium SAS-127]|nr:hypothetical protein CEW92_15320 [Bacillaceae bacterium SAS-127]